MQIENNVFVVSGGASGLGAGASRMLVAHGGKVVIADVADATGEALAAELGARFIHCDVTQATNVSRAVEAAAAWGTLRGVVNCAGIAPAAKTVGKSGAHPLEVFERTVSVNLTGSFNLLRLAAEAMAALPPTDSGERGVMISTASIAAYEGQVGQAAYAASKAGVVGMTLPIARDLAPLGIRNMTIAPGLFATPMMFGLPEAVQTALASSVPFPSRLGVADDFAKLVHQIIVNEMLNGEVIRLDGALRLPPR